MRMTIVKQENLYRLVRVLGQIDQVKQGAHALDLSHQDIPVSEKSDIIEQEFSPRVSVRPGRENTRD